MELNPPLPQSIHIPVPPVSPETAEQVEARIRNRKDALFNHIVKISDDLKDQASDSLSRIADKVEHSVDTVTETLETRVDSVSDKLEHGVTQVSETLHEGLHKIAGQVDQTVTQAKAAMDIRSHVEAQPFLAVGVAVGVGFVLKKMLTGGRHTAPLQGPVPPLEMGPTAGSGPSVLGSLAGALGPVVAMAAQTYLSHVIERRFGGSSDGESSGTGMV